jgi:peptidoglycan/xylan/chitin deacetylase (PgdA/CDA1 family)
VKADYEVPLILRTLHPERHGLRSKIRRGAAVVGISLALVAITGNADESSCKGTIYLTLDTGNMAHAESIAKTLKEEDVKATFFLANERTFRHDHALDASWDGYWQARAQEGHVFGNHTWSHMTARRDEGEKIVFANGNKRVTLDRTGFCTELRRVNDAFERATGRRLAGLWRAPGGRTTQNSIRYAASCGYPVHVHWNDAGFLGDELPSEQYPNARLLERALKNIRPGDILLMHLGIWSRKDPFAPMLKPLIEGLKARGLCFGTLSEAKG